MVRRTAHEAHKFRSLPFFRMHLRRRSHSRQHQLLLDLENGGNQVFYAGPAFATSEDLNAAYIGDLVTKRSVIIRPSAIGPLPDDKSHHVAFQLPSPVFFCSEPKPIETVDLDALLSESLKQKAATQPRREPTEFFLAVADEMLDVYEERSRSRQ